MGMLGWVIMGLAIWHFTIFMPDRFWGGIVGAFVGALVGSVLVGLIIYGVRVSALRIPAKRPPTLRHPVRGARRADRHRRDLPGGHAPRTRTADGHRWPSSSRITELPDTEIVRACGYGLFRFP